MIYEDFIVVSKVKKKVRVVARSVDIPYGYPIDGGSFQNLMPDLETEDTNPSMWTVDC